jgi:predicted  nucleic acid-binding Zn-ribbon protein
MAIEMGKAMDQNVSKDSLLKQADYYITELDKVHSTFKTDGQNKINDLSQKKNDESTSLSSTIASLKIQLSTIQDQIRIKENSLSEIDNKYQPQIDEIALKLEANDTVKNTFIGNINKVKMNISNNLK